MEKKYILSYDHGTSGMKTAIVSTKGEVVGFDVEEYGLYYPEPGAVEQDPMEWWNALVNTTRNLLDRNLVPVEDIVACTTSNQMCGTIPVDREGSPLFNCMTWMDSRGAPVIKDLVGGLVEVSGYSLSKILKWIPKTGGAPGLSGKDIMGHILWIKKNRPDLYEKTWKFMDCKDFLTFKLTGEVVTSYDCGILTWVVNDKDPDNIFYDDDLIRTAGLDREKLPDLFPATHVVGPILPEMAQALGLSRDTQVVLGAGDVAAAAVGSGAVMDLEAHISIGSSSWCVVHLPQRKLDIFHMVASLPSAIPGRYMALGEQETAGINLVWLRDNILYHKDELLVEENVPDVYKIFDKMVSEIKPGDSKVIFTPWMIGERSPVEDHTVRGGLHNISLDIDRRHIIRAIFEGVALNSRWLVKYLEKLVKKTFPAITMVGGGAKSDAWCQIYADVLNRNIRQVDNPKEGNAIGGAFIASVGLGYVTWEQIPDLIKVKKEFSPRPEYQNFYNDLFKEFTGLYKNNHKMYRRLNKFAE